MEKQLSSTGDNGHEVSVRGIYGTRASYGGGSDRLVEQGAAAEHVAEGLQ